jgi:spermidine synthase
MAMKQYMLLYYNAGPCATVSVMERNDGIRFLTVDGKTDASSNYQHDMKTQVLLGQLPLLYHPEPDRVFVVGLGSGVTVGSILTHTVRTVDCAEISNSVIEAAQYFSEVNHHALEDKRLRIIPRDARNALMTYDKDYDVIISQPSNPWISGQSSLFSYEWYKIVADRLSEGGIFSQWIPAYHMSKQDVKIIIHTLRSVFPHVTAWTSGSAGELILIAKKGEKLEVPYDKFLARAKEVRVQNDIERLGYNVEMLPFWTFVMNEGDISTYLYANHDAPIRLNTDNLLLTEFSTPKQMAAEHMVERFSESDRLHGEMDALMKILVDVDMDAAMKMLDAG